MKYMMHIWIFQTSYNSFEELLKNYSNSFQMITKDKLNYHNLIKKSQWKEFCNACIGFGFLNEFMSEAADVK